MVFRTIPKTFLQIFCKIMLNSRVIIKSIKDADDNFLDILKQELVNKNL